LKPVVTGGIHVKRYHIEYPDLLLIYTKRDDDFSNLPNIKTYIEKFKNQITCKEVTQNKHPLYSLHRPRKEQIFTKEKKIIGVITGDKIIVAHDTKKVYATDGTYLFGIKNDINPNFLLGILNSKLFVFVYRLLAIEKGRVLPQVKPTIIANLPIRTINHLNETEKLKQDEIAKLVEFVTNMKNKIHNTKSSPDITNLTRQIETAEKMINDYVYDLYGLTKEEIQYVESEVA